MDKTLVGTEESAGAVIRRCSLNKVFEKMRKIHRIFRSLFLMKFQALRSATLLKSDSSKDVFT